MVEEFKEFIRRGNLVELAVAFVVGAAFGALVTAFIENLVTPIIGAIFGQPDFSRLTIDLWSDAVITYGVFLNALLTFLAVAASLFFFVVKPFNAWQERRAGEEEEAPAAAPPEDIALLREIRDALSR